MTYLVITRIFYVNICGCNFNVFANYFLTVGNINYGCIWECFSKLLEVLLNISLAFRFLRGREGGVLPYNLGDYILQIL